jgi:ribosomal protein S18 acetylase RimI-like enzyme
VVDLEFRHATPADAPAVIEFWRVAAEDSHRPADTRDAVMRLIDRDSQALLLVLDSDVIVGSVVLGWDGWRFHVYRLAVRPSHRRRGIGHALLERHQPIMGRARRPPRSNRGQARRARARG